MSDISFRQLPLAVRIATGVAFYNLWWGIEEFIIDRYGIWKFMPYYHRADPCVWDLCVGSLIFFAVWRASRVTRRPAHEAA